MANWLDVSKLTYDIPVTLQPNTSYLLYIEANSPDKVILKLDNVEVGNFATGEVKFTSNPSGNLLNLSSTEDIHITWLTLEEADPLRTGLMGVLQGAVKSKDDKEIIHGSTVYDIEVLEVKRSVKGSLYISNMDMLEVRLKGYHNLLGEWIQYKRTVASYEVDDNQDYVIDYGLFKVTQQDYDDDTQETKLIAFDKMINTQKEYKREDFALTYPATIKQVFDRVLELCDLETDNLAFPNMNETVDEEVWHNTEYTYRDVLTHIAQVAGVTINIKDNKVHIKQPTDIDFTITADKLQKLKIGEDYGSINILNLTREPQHDNYAFPTNWTEIPLDNRKELVFENNPIIDKRREYFAPLIFDKINNLQYKEMVADTFGFGIFEIGDIVKVEEYNTGLTHEVVITEEISTHKHQLISEVTSDKPTTSKEEYVVVTDERRQGQRTYILVDQLNGKIELAVTDINGLNDKYAQIEIDLDEIKQTVSNIDTTNNVIPNFQGYNGYKGWSWVGGSLKAVTGLTAMVGLRQSTNWIRRAVDSDAIYRLEFFTSGRAISPKGFVTGGEEYSYNTKVHHGTQGYTLTVREFDALDGAVQHETPFAIDTNELNPYFTFTLQPNTRYVDLAYDIPTTVTPTNTLSVTEQVFNKGRPGEYAFSVAEFVNKTESQITQLSDSVTTTVTKVETIDGQVIENTSRISQNATNIALKANTIDLQGKVGFSDLSTQGRTQIYGGNIITGTLQATNATFVNATITGNLNAGTVGNLLVNGSGITFPNGKLKLNSITNSIDIGTLKLKHSTITNDFGTHDVLTFGEGVRQGMLGTSAGYSFVQTSQVYGPEGRLELGKYQNVLLSGNNFIRSQNGNWWYIDISNTGQLVITRRDP